MALISDYLDLADASYSDAPQENLTGWELLKTEKATWRSNGFQGSVFGNNEDVIVAFAGTKGGPLTAPVSQNLANARIGTLVIPNMAGPAKKLVRWAEQIANGRQVSIVGHSLGGALAQVVGAWSGHPFVSLNGPGMATHLKLSAFNLFKPRQLRRTWRARNNAATVGLCLNVTGDFVGNWGKGHLGEVRQLVPTGASSHSIDAIRAAAQPNGELEKEPWMLSKDWPVTPYSGSSQVEFNVTAPPLAQLLSVSAHFPAINIAPIVIAPIVNAPIVNAPLAGQNPPPQLNRHLVQQPTATEDSTRTSRRQAWGAWLAAATGAAGKRLGAFISDPCRAGGSRTGRRFYRPS